MTGIGSQSSLTVASGKTGTSGHSIGDFTAGQTMTGGTRSSVQVQVTWAWAALPQRSVTE
jgi:hypothetical protein